MDQDLKHQCKFCSKRFACGPSLGGHMRSHVTSAANANANANDVVEEEKIKVEAGRGYGLRENPKRNWRLSKSFDLGKDCGECSKEFQSWRALFGHMRCHSVKVSKQVVEEEDVGGVEGSWSGGSHALVEVRRRKRILKRSVSVSVSSSSASELSYSKEQEDVAISLMMLSRDVRFGFSHFTESSDKTSAVFDGLGNVKNKELELSDVLDVDCDDEIEKSMADFASDSDYFEVTENFDDSIKKKKSIGFDWIDTKVKRNSIVVASKSGSDPEKKRSKYDCATCNKSFDTHQALGGYRASHNRMKGACFAENNSLDAEDGASIDLGVGNVVAEKMKGNHQCLICGKVFGSGQALGGHKRSHFAIASPSVVDVIQQDLIDLNLPAQVEEDSSKGSVCG